MGKRSDFVRIEKDFYPTPHMAVLPLLPHLKANTKYIEPCCGKNDLINHLSLYNHECVFASDTELDVMTTKYDTDAAQCFITNPPWKRKILHPTIENLKKQAPTWLLFDAGWMQTKQAIPLLPYCLKIVCVGRVKWIPGSEHISMDDCCWYLFDNVKTKTEFIGHM